MTRRADQWVAVGSEEQIGQKDLLLVCAHGHTMWYPADNPGELKLSCGMVRPAARSRGPLAQFGLEQDADHVECGLDPRPLTDAEHAAWLIGGYAAVKAMVRP